MISKQLLDYAAKEFDFDINTFKIKYVSIFNNPEIEIYTFYKNGKEYIIDFVPEYIQRKRQTRAELNFIDYLAKNNVTVAPVLKTINNELFISMKDNGNDYNICVIEMANGEFWNKNDLNKWNDKIFFNWGKVMGNMHRLAKDYKSDNKYNVPDIINRTYTGWGSFFDCLKENHVIYDFVCKLLNEIKDYPTDRDSYGLIHCDLHPYNFHIDGEKIIVFDFNDNIYGWFALDIGIALYHGLDWSRKDDYGNDYTNAIIKNFMEGYLSVNNLSDFWISKIPLFMKYRQIWFNTELGNIQKNQKEWAYKIKNDILFDGFELKIINELIKIKTERLMKCTPKVGHMRKNVIQ